MPFHFHYNPMQIRILTSVHLLFANVNKSYVMRHNFMPLLVIVITNILAGYELYIFLLLKLVFGTTGCPVKCEKGLN